MTKVEQSQKNFKTKSFNSDGRIHTASISSAVVDFDIRKPEKVNAADTLSLPYSKKKKLSTTKQDKICSAHHSLPNKNHLKQSQQSPP